MVTLYRSFSTQKQFIHKASTYSTSQVPTYWHSTNSTMNTKLNICLTFICIFSVQVILTEASSGFAECTKSEDCGPGKCCVLGMARFSVPACKPLGQLSDVCRMNNDPKNMTLSYPNNLEIPVYSIYTLFCPCESNLKCTAAQCISNDA